jgi:hypothetical protein
MSSNCAQYEWHRTVISEGAGLNKGTPTGVIANGVTVLLPGGKRNKIIRKAQRQALDTIRAINGLRTPRGLRDTKQVVCQVFPLHFVSADVV